MRPSSEAETGLAQANGPAYLLRAAMQALEMIARGANLSDILTNVCVAIDAENPGIISTILLMDPDGMRLWPTAGPRVPAGWARAISPLRVAQDMGSCGTAAFRRELVIISDIATDPRWSAAPPEQSREVAISYGLRAAWSKPLLSRGDQVLGTFALYYCEPRTPDVADLRLIDDASHIALTAIEVAQSRKALEKAVVDLTERRRAEQALRERERESLMILDAIPGLVAILKPNGEVDAVNHELTAFCGQPLEAMKEWGTNGTVHPEDLPHMVPIFTQAIASGEPYDFETRVRRFDGVYRWLQVRGLPHRDTSGQIVRWYVLLSDVDDRKRAEDAIDKARSEFARVARVVTLSALTASIAHEVNQPLSGIITNAGTCLRMLNASPPNIEGARETARRTIRDGNRASDVIKRLRAMFSKRESTPESVDLNEATREVVALSQTILQRNRVALQLELTEPLPLILGDRVQLQQVILNLLRNASEAMADVDDRPRQLLVRTAPEGTTDVRVTVRDVGVGLDPQVVDKLFDSFYTTKEGGMGIGLSVSRSIIERHHGRMWAEPNVGPGATFAFTIPLA